MEPALTLAATFTPEEMQTMWGLTAMEWRSLQQRRLLNASERRHGATKRTRMSAVQAIGLGMQLALVHQVGLPYAKAQSLVREASGEIEKMWMASDLDVKPLRLKSSASGHVQLMIDAAYYVKRVHAASGNRLGAGPHV